MNIINNASCSVFLALNVSVSELRMECMDPGDTLLVDDIPFSDVIIDDSILGSRLGPVFVSKF